jgi:uncharacterized protein
VEAPVRTCLACRTRRPQPDLMRLVVEHGTVTADPLARRPGRGAYVCAGGVCVEALLARPVALLARALRLDPATVRVDGEALRSAVQDRTGQDEETTAAGRAHGRVPQAVRGAWT